MRILVDAQLPPGLARWLSGQGHDAQHVADVGLLSASDGEIWRYAREQGSVVITKDEDFPVVQTLRGGLSVVWVRVGNTSNAELLRIFSAALPAIEKAFAEGEPLIEVR